MLVQMYRTADSANDGSPATWVVEKPDGTILDTTDSPTQGLQEAMDYAAVNGYNLKKYGGGIASKNNQDVSILWISGTLVIPPLQTATWEIDGTICVGNGITIDSMMTSRLTFNGQLVAGADCDVAVRLKPTNLLPQDQGAGRVITSSVIRLPSISMSGRTSATCIELDTSEHPIADNEFYFMEPNNNNVQGSVGVRVKHGAGFSGNKLTVIGAHGAEGTTICNGINGALPGAGNSYGNSWFVSMAPHGGVGLEDFSWQDEFTLSIAGTPSIGVRAPSGIAASNWRYRILRNNASTGFTNR